MTFEIITISDVLKFALPLFDYLDKNGYTQEAEILASLVDSCYPQDNLVAAAHHRAYRMIRDDLLDLPLSYKKALDDSLKILSKY